MKGFASLVFVLVFMLAHISVSGQAWSKSYPELFQSYSFDGGPYPKQILYPTGEANKFLIIGEDSTYRINKEGELDLRFATPKNIDKKNIRTSNGMYYFPTISIDNSFTVHQIDSVGRHIDSVELRGIGRYVGGLEIFDDLLYTVSIAENWIYLIGFDRNGNQQITRSFNYVGWKNDKPPRLILKEGPNNNFYINIIANQGDFLHEIASYNQFITVKKVKPEYDSAKPRIFNELSFVDFSFDEKGNIYTKLFLQGIAKFLHGTFLVKANSLREDHPSSRSYGMGINTDNNVIGLVDLQYTVSNELLCFDEQLKLIYEKKIPAKTERYNIVELGDFTLYPNEIGGFTFLLNAYSNVRYGVNLADMFPIIIKTDSMCEFPDLELEDVSSSVQSDLTTSEIKIYPNPTQGIFTVENEIYSGQPITITVLTLQGQLIKQILSIEGVTKVDLRNNTPGVYFVQVKNKSGAVNKKIVLH